MMMLENDRPHVLREMIYVCRPAGVISIPGVYGGLVDKIPMGQAMNKGLTFRMGQTHVNRWTDDLLRRIEEGQIDPSFVITHTVGARGRTRDVQGVPRQAGQLHQGRAEALKPRGRSMTYIRLQHRPLRRVTRKCSARARVRSARGSARPGARLVQHRPRRGRTARAAALHAHAGHGRQGRLVRAYGMREIGAGMLTLSLDRDLGLWAASPGTGWTSPP